ncbi:MAG TPA: hypothetical protein PKD12_16915 [Nitrospira sp.]|nr:hypothetical protein [Nitrospira sp.]
MLVDPQLMSILSATDILHGFYQTRPTPPGNRLVDVQTTVRVGLPAERKKVPEWLD